MYVYYVYFMPYLSFVTVLIIDAYNQSCMYVYTHHARAQVSKNQEFLFHNQIELQH